MKGFILTTLHIGWLPSPGFPHLGVSLYHHLKFGVSLFVVQNHGEQTAPAAATGDISGAFDAAAIVYQGKPPLQAGALLVQISVFFSIQVSYHLPIHIRL